MPAKIDLIGRKFGRLIVTGLGGTVRGISGASKRMWSCSCECGNTSKVTTGALTSGNTQSCGCGQVDAVKRTMTQHGSCTTPEYLALQRIRSRVRNPNNANYDLYSTVGMDERWESDFEDFLREIGPIPRDGQDWSVGRIDNDVGYFAGNIRWETDEQQARNHTKQSNNTSGVTGVKWQKKNGVLVSVVASCELLSGKRQGRSFSICKYGEQEAFKLACECRKKMIEDLNAQGAGYADKHGL